MRILRLAHDDTVDLGPVPALAALLRALLSVLPAEAMVSVEGSPAAEIRAFLERHATRSSPGEGGLALTARGWPPRVRISRGGTRYELPFSFDVIDRLADLAERYPVPEVADHLVVVRDERVLVEAHDLSDGAVLVSRHLGQDVIDELRRRLGAPSS